jgi:hypothetical protein
MAQSEPKIVTLNINSALVPVAPTISSKSGEIHYDGATKKASEVHSESVS